MTAVHYSLCILLLAHLDLVAGLFLSSSDFCVAQSSSLHVLGSQVKVWEYSREKLQL